MIAGHIDLRYEFPDMKTYSCTLEVRGYELDSFGHVNHANYLNYLEHARWKMLAEEGITLPLLNSLKLWPVIAKLEVTYLKPTFMGETLEIKTRCIDHTNAKMIFEQNIYRGDVLVLKAEVHGVTVNEQGRPVKHPEMMERFWKS